jgi:lipopolysaccharide transport system ATP-binding protein
MTDTIISAERLGKKYRIQHQQERQRYVALRDVIAARLGTAVRWLTPRRSNERPESQQSMRSGSLRSRSPLNEDFWALHDLSFEIEQGEVVGIIGRNGAGKSTLLRILSRITEPTTGRVTIHGRLGSLLEVGTGFHPELTGRENIFLNGAILGMNRAEIKRKFDDIVSFAEVEKFLDTPVKRYSSGMYVRLAFSVAAHLDPEILVVDEVLAVGDAEFQKKCLGRMDAAAREGRTVLFVSHNMAVIQRLCTRGLFLEKGRLVEDGPIEKVVSRYFALDQVDSLGRFQTNNRQGTGWARINSCRLVDPQGNSIRFLHADDTVTLDLELSLAGATKEGSLRGLVIEVMFFNEYGQPLTSVMSVDDPGIQLPSAASCRVQVQIESPFLIPGRYRMDLFLGIPFLQHVDEVSEAMWFEILPPRKSWRPYEFHPIRGNMCHPAVWRVSGELQQSIT